MTETQTVDLASWLTAIWDEEERLAKAATPGPWRYNNAKHTHLPNTAYFEEAVFAGPAGRGATVIAATGETDDPQSMRDAEHIAAHDPASVLARIAADRKILEIHSPLRHAFPEDAGLCDACPSLWPCATVLALASPCKGREGWQEEWE